MKGVKSMDEKTVIKGKYVLPQVPGGPYEEEDLLVCRYNGFAYISLFFMCIITSLILFIGAIVNFTSGVTEGGGVLLFGALIILAPGIVLWFYITRYVLIFYPDGLVYRDLRGNVYHVKDEEVEYVLPIGYGKNRCFKLKTRERDIVLGVYARHFYEAENYALSKYPQK